MTSRRTLRDGDELRSSGNARLPTATSEEESIGSALAVLWQRHRQSNMDRISLLEHTSASVLRGDVDDEALVDGANAAHKLAGSLGTFGFDEGSRAALEVESLVREPNIDGRLLAEAVVSLRSAMDEDPGARPADPHRVRAEERSADAGTDVLLVSYDADLVSRLTVEGAAKGLTVISRTEIPSADGWGAGPPRTVMFDDSPGYWTRSEMLSSAAELAHQALVIVLTDRDAYEDRMQLAEAGVSGVISHSQGARQTISFLAERLAQRQEPAFGILALCGDRRLNEVLRQSFPASQCSLTIHNDTSTFWEALEVEGTDLVVVGWEGTQLGASAICKMIRAHPRWHRIPVVAVGPFDAHRLERAMSAGVDDYLVADVSSHDLRLRLRRHLDRAWLAHVRSNVDPLTGAESRLAAEHSLDGSLLLAARRGEPFALALIAIDQSSQLSEAEGNAVCNVIMHRLGSQLLGKFPDADIVARWSHDEFAVGMYGTSQESAAERVRLALDEFALETFATTSGRLACYTASAGVAGSPSAGSTLSSLERLSETALGRAKEQQNCIVTAGERKDRGENVCDVVLVEDDDSVADVIEHALRLRGYEFTRFSDGAEAAKMLGEGRVKARVVLLDVGLPSLDGFGVLQILRNEGILADTRVIMLTARSSEAETLRALGLGATEHITKPFSIPILLGRLDQTLSLVVA